MFYTRSAAYGVEVAGYNLNDANNAICRTLHYANAQCSTVVDINECESNPCKNRATCEDKVNSYSCKCMAGYTGTNCESGTFSRQFSTVVNVV